MRPTIRQRITMEDIVNRAVINTDNPIARQHQTTVKRSTLKRRDGIASIPILRANIGSHNNPPGTKGGITTRYRNMKRIPIQEGQKKGIRKTTATHLFNDNSLLTFIKVPITAGRLGKGNIISIRVRLGTKPRLPSPRIANKHKNLHRPIPARTNKGGIALKSTIMANPRSEMSISKFPLANTSKNHGTNGHKIGSSPLGRSDSIGIPELPGTFKASVFLSTISDSLEKKKWLELRES